MNQSQRPSQKSSTSSQVRVDYACSKFEEQWHAGQNPKIEEFIKDAQVHDRQHLLRVLIALEIRLGDGDGKVFDASHYRRRFADDVSVVDSALESFDNQCVSRHSTESTIDVQFGQRSPISSQQDIKIEFTDDRYTIVRQIGRGGFAVVYLALDKQLGRHVALKVPRLDKFVSDAELSLFIQEARNAAQLDHPGIVKVYDVQRNLDLVYIVQQYIDGADLATHLKTNKMTPKRSAELLFEVAKAVGHAHKKGCWHCDLKPANLMIDSEGRPYVTDFGLALFENMQHDRAGSVAGTLAYMSPEQIRGEAHRLDGRTDIWSLGVILYELITGRRPFSADSVGASADALDTRMRVRDEILNRDPRPPRMIAPDVPRELARICLACLSKRAADRYQTTADLIEDLELWLKNEFAQTVDNSPSGVDVIPNSNTKVRIVPKGLRSFDSSDAEFFLELLPGPHDRDGLPKRVRFWKTQIEKTNPAETFSVGVMYGPSGCGKSSLVRAGLIPRLSDDVLPIYVEATSTDTEARLANALRRDCPLLPEVDDLPRLIASLRNQGGWQGRKVLIVIDQFEQWLHVHDSVKENPLVLALRQCDGKSVQCLVLVRDDFYVSLNRFFQQLEVRLVEEHNSALVDLFDTDHARKVLWKLGLAYGKLGEQTSHSIEEQTRFIEEAVENLAEDGKVVCVRLAVFAEMMKGRPWTKVSLRDVGGAQGVGSTFLEETFSATTAPPSHRFHQDAARAVLKALLPEQGTNIKGVMKSHKKLMEYSGYINQHAEFDTLLEILDRDVRLITPTEPTGVEQTDSVTPAIETKYYQLTHDFLIPSLRSWLTHKQRETRRGRAELKLSETAAAWKVKPENRQLPSLWEYLQIAALTSRKQWTQSQAQLMASARRYYGRSSLMGSIVGGVFGLALLLGSLAVIHQFHVARINSLIDNLFVAEVSEVPAIALLFAKEPYGLERLQVIAESPSSDDNKRLRSVFVLSDGPGERSSQLIRSSMLVDLPTLSIIRNRITPFANEISDELWDLVSGGDVADSSVLRVATLLAVANPSDDRLRNVSPVIVPALVAEKTLDLDRWLEYLRPIASALIPEMRSQFLDNSTLAAERQCAAHGLSRFAGPELLSELILSAEPFQLTLLSPGITRHEEEVVSILRRTLQRDTDMDSAKEWNRSRLNAIVTLLQLQRFVDVMPALLACTDPTVRTMFIVELHDYQVSPERLRQAFDSFSDPVARQAVLLALLTFPGQKLVKVREHLMGKLESLIRQGQYQSERSAAERLLREWRQTELIQEVNVTLRRTAEESSAWLHDHDWWVDSNGHVMAVFRGPIRFTKGTIDEPLMDEAIESLTDQTIQRSFAVSSHEVTMLQYQRFWYEQFGTEPDFARDKAKSSDAPANKVSLVDAMKYCRWLSEKAGIKLDQMCYPTQSEIEPDHAFIPDEQLSKTGYRLLTEFEWECVCRAGSRTPWICGSNPSHLTRFAWYQQNADSQLHSVGSLLPNPWGMFDMSGNALEWCLRSTSGMENVMKGGSLTTSTNHLRSAHTIQQSNTGYSYNGFRVGCTMVELP